MPTGGQLGSGVRMAYAAGSPQTWIEITQVLEAEPFQFERDRVDVSTHGTESERSYIPGLRDATDARALLLADLDRATSPSHLGLKDLESSQDIIWIRIGIPITADLDTTPYWVQETRCRVSKWGLNTPIDGRKEIDTLFQYAGGGITEYESIAHASLFA